MTAAQTLVDYLREHDLRLTTAESCTAGRIVTLLAEVPGSGSLIESGYVVYSLKPSSACSVSAHAPSILSISPVAKSLRRWPLAPCTTPMPMSQWRPPACSGQTTGTVYPPAPCVLPGRSI